MTTNVEPVDAPAEQHAPYEDMLRDFSEGLGANLDAMSVMYLLFRTDTITLSVMESVALRPHGLTHAGFVLLMTLWMMGPQETRALAWMQRVSRPSIVSAVDTWERAGFVRRVRSEADRRLVTVELTHEGRRTVERARQDWHECERRIAGALTTREQRSLARMLRKLDDAARSGVCDTPD
jgi:DNA-binding MarR family transcriptional regulator